MFRTGDSVLPPLRGWDGVLDFENRSTLEAWCVAWSQLRSCAQPDGLGALLPNGCRDAPRSALTAIIVSQARTSLPRLVASTRRLDVAASLAAAIPLIGAGPGLTPSWDYLLIGYMCGLRATAGTDCRQARFFGRFGKAVHGASAGTTAVSREYIQRTVEGTGPEWIEDTLAAIGSGDSARTFRATARALRIGNTSGTDMMLGAILGSSARQASTEAAEVLSVLSCRWSKSLPMRDGNGHPAHAQLV